MCICVSVCCSLFMWVQPELTQKLYVGLLVAFISSCLLPYKLLGFIIGTFYMQYSYNTDIVMVQAVNESLWCVSSSSSGVYAGIKFFIIDFIFKSCPKLRQRYDTPYIIWTNLPTDMQLKERGNTVLSRRVSTNCMTHPDALFSDQRCCLWAVSQLTCLCLYHGVPRQEKTTSKQCEIYKIICSLKLIKYVIVQNY